MKIHPDNTRTNTYFCLPYNIQSYSRHYHGIICANEVRVNQYHSVSAWALEPDYLGSSSGCHLPSMWPQATTCPSVPQFPSLENYNTDNSFPSPSLLWDNVFTKQVKPRGYIWLVNIISWQLAFYTLNGLSRDGLTSLVLIHWISETHN